jgi:hypothetical protein
MNETTMTDAASADEPGIGASPSLLAPEGTFVIRLRSDSAPDEQLLSGRVEHVMSGDSERFRTLPALLQFMARHLGSTTG